MSMLPADLKLSDDQGFLDRPRNYMEELQKLIPKDRFSKEEYAVIEDKLLILRLLTQEQLSKRDRDEAFIRAQKMSLEIMAQENKTQILSLQKELSSAKAELEINQRTIADLQQKLKEDNKKNKILKDSNDALTNQVLTLQRESSSVKAELQINQMTIADLQQKLEKENKNNKILKDSNDALTDQVITLKRDLTSIKVDSDDTRRTTEDLKQRLEGSTKQVNILKHQNHQKFIKLDAIRTRLIRIKARLRSLDEETKLRNQLRTGINWQWYFTDTNYYRSPLYYGEFKNSQSKIRYSGKSGIDSIPAAVAAVIADFVPELTTRESLETIPNRTEVLLSQDILDTIVTETLSSKPIDSEASAAVVIADFSPELTTRESLETVPNRTDVLFSQDTLDTIVTETLSSKPIDSEASEAAVIADFAPELTTRESLETTPNRTEFLFSQDTLDTIVTDILSSKPIDSEASEAVVIADISPELTTRESLETVPNRTDVLFSQDTLDTIVTETLSSEPIDSEASGAVVIADFAPELATQKSLETVPNRTEVLFSQDTLDTIVTETQSSKPIDSEASEAAVIADFAPELTTRESLETAPNRTEFLFSQDTLDTIVTETLSSKPIDSETSSESETLPCASDALCSVSRSVSFEIEPVSSVPDITSSVSKVEFEPQSMQKTETFRPKDVIATQNDVTLPNEKLDAEVPHSLSKEKASKAVLFATEVQCSTKKVESSANEASFMEKKESSLVSEAIFSETTMSAAEVAMCSTAIATVTVEAKSVSIPQPRPRSLLLKYGEIDALTVVKSSNPGFLKTTNLKNNLEPAPEKDILNTKSLALTPPIAPRLRQHYEDEVDIRVKSTRNEARPLSLSSIHVPSPRPRRRPASVLMLPLAETGAVLIKVNTSKTETTAAVEVSKASVVEATVSSVSSVTNL